MKVEFQEYLNSIGIIGNLIERIEEIYNFYLEICPEEIEDIFINEYISEDGSREYESVWFFSDNYVMEAQNITKNDADAFDCLRIKNSIIRWEIKKQDYDFHEFSGKSRFNINTRFTNGIIGDMKSSQQNCNHLKEIFQKYIVPNIK